jgi:hydrogenase nickel incorporation protein HypA/HybF
MHELGIVVHVINQIEKLAKENKVNKVVELTLEVGEVSGVVKEYFVEAFNWAIKKTEYMKECKLNYITIQGITYCEDCKKTYSTTEFGKECPYCHSGHTYLVTGNDVVIKNFKVE